MEKYILKYIDLLPDERTKYIMHYIYCKEENKKKNINELKYELSQKLRLSFTTISDIIHRAFDIIEKEKMKEEQNIFKQIVINCYDEDGHLSLSKMAQVKNIDENELKDIFTEYIYSLTNEEIKMACTFDFSLEAIKFSNVQVLKHLVNGFSKKIDTTIFVSNNQSITKMEQLLIQCLDSMILSKHNEKEIQKIYCL